MHQDFQSRATSAIWGAKKRVIGNNPLAIGIPNANASEPIVLDMAMSQAAVGKVTTWLREGKKAPDNWGIDAEGNPTSDTKEILNSAVIPMGEYKGAGLALMFELITAAAGAAYTHEIFACDSCGIDSAASKIFFPILKREASPFQYPGERGGKRKSAI